MAFHAVMKLWGKRPLKVYGPRITETVLTILCHILKGEKMIAEKLEKTKTNGEAAPGTSGGAAAAASGADAAAVPSTSGRPAAPAAAAAEPEVNQENLRTLMDMGFPRERCMEAILSTTTLDQATDYLLSNPQIATPPAPDPMQALAAAGMGSGAAAIAAAAAAASGADQDELMRAIAMSLGENVVVSTDGAAGQKDLKKQEEEEQERLDKEDFEVRICSIVNCDFT